MRCRQSTHSYKIEAAQAFPYSLDKAGITHQVLLRYCDRIMQAQTNVGTTSTTVMRQPLTSTTWVLPVGCRYVRGGNRISASEGKAETHFRSAPRSRLFLVTILKMRLSLLRQCVTAVLMSVVVDMSASCTGDHESQSRAGGTHMQV
jgi:hypothetical protein